LKYGNKKAFKGCSPFIHEDTTSESLPSYPPPKHLSKCAPKYEIACHGGVEREIETDFTAVTSAFPFEYAETGCCGRKPKYLHTDGKYAESRRP
jgi:hypothetical protein